VDTKTLAQVITPHTIEVRVEKKSKTEGWEITRAVTDGVYDEVSGKFLEEAKEEKDSLEALLGAPTREEKAQENFTSIP